MFASMTSRSISPTNCSKQQQQLLDSNNYFVGPSEAVIGRSLSRSKGTSSPSRVPLVAAYEMQTLPFLVILLCSVISVSSLRCYVCNSLMNKDCEDNYEKSVIYCPVKSFGGKKAVKAIGCRISRQSVKDEKSVVRECAYSGPNVENKSQKGSLGVSRVITQCEKDLCNPASTMFSYLSLASLLVFFRL